LYAESEFLFEEYAEALPNYLRLNKQFPDNDNINYKIGVCYLNDPYEKKKAISFLEKAVQNINPKFKENSFKETGAPLEANFYLGNAYRINNELQKAIETYEHFKEQADPELYDLELVNEQIRACNNAIDLKTRPIDIEIENLGDRINSRFSDVQPVISGDETRLVFVQQQAFFDALAFSEKIDGEWSFPRILMEELQVDEDVYPTSLSYDGNTLFIYRNDNFTGNLYTSQYINGRWSTLTKLNENINTKYWESHACTNKQGDTLYFTSNRKGGLGGLDIYYAVKGSNNDWGRAVNLGSTINTKYNEETPFLTSDGKTLYFSSYGHYNMGGYDVFYTTKLSDGSWAVPINAGYPINTTDDDVFFDPVHNGAFAYFPRYRDEGFGRMDIYRFEIFSKTHPRKFLIKGMVGIRDGASLGTPVRVAIVEKYSRDTIAVTYADQATGAFTFSAAKGAYDLLIEAEGYEPASHSMEIPEDYLQKEMALTSAILLTQAGHLMEMTPKIEDKIKVRDTLIYVDSDQPIEIPMTLERDAELEVDIFHNDKLNRFESHKIEKRKFIYTYVPVPGENLLKFKLTDRQGSLSYKDIRIIYTPAVLSTEDSLAKVAAAMTAQTLSEDVLEAYRQRLAENAHGDLKQVLLDLSLAATGISSVDQLVNYLKEQAASHDYTEEDVDRLIEITPFDERAWTEHLHQTMTDAAEGDLKNVLVALDIEEQGIISEEDLVGYLKTQAAENEYTPKEVDDLILKVLQIKYLSDYLEQLINICMEDELKTALEDIDLNQAGLYNLTELYEHVLNQAESYGYDAGTANRLFAELAQHMDLKELMDHLTKVSTGDLQGLLMGTDTEAEDFGNASDLMKYLLDAAAGHDFTQEDVLRLLMDYIGLEDLKEIIKILISISSGDLQDLLISLDLERDGIHDLADLFHYLLDQASIYDYTQDDVIRLFLHLLKILENKSLTDELSATMTQDMDTGGRNFWYLWAPVGLLLIFVIIFLAWRRKKSLETDQTA
jgi:Ca2+-binding EF-hand superfamily protein/tetratricopeptide (TPR) repeat protein